jgi:hypothetical protein
VNSGVHAVAVFLNYGQYRRDTGIAMLPGELLGYGLDGPQRWLTLRAGASLWTPGTLINRARSLYRWPTRPTTRRLR